ncbi:SLBB domain-containing protein [Vibrio sp. VB16]|uniref:SLBB domain-containing protein n=1 Tax=Vibrio sp. VB16 TaxID=2785746 RepID=UPI00189DF153|nr:SLBB domain-containing protein [Vibrio sp. VB16]UGA57366.1 SLBB domain-containing protein [Vibrio sp. VB16]
MSIKNTVIAVIASAVSFSVLAFTPTPAQIKQFQNLPKAQQEQLARQYGVDVSALTGEATQAVTQQVQENPPIRATSLAAPVEQASTLASKKSINNNGLRPFGYDVFSGQPMAFTVVDNMPVPLDYIMAPGDEITVRLYGKTSQELNLTIDREGFIHFPSFGPLSIAGQTFAQSREYISDLVKQKRIGVEVVVSMGAMRTMQVFLVGDITQPGAYNVNGLTSLTQALIASGGVKETGTLRNIQLKRKGKTIATLDLYDLLLKGDASNDVRLLAGDTLFVPSKMSDVSLRGEIKRPAIYELKGKTTLGQLLSIGGGATPRAYLSKVSIKRISSNGTEQITADLATRSGRNLLVKDGDEVVISPSSSALKNAVAIRGEVVRQGALRFVPGMKISDVITSAENDLKQNADLDYALVVREINADREIKVLQFDLGNALADPKSIDNIQLKERDQIFIFDNGLALDYWFGSNQNKKVTSNEKLVDKSTEFIDASTGAVVKTDSLNELNVQGNDSLTRADNIKQTSREVLLNPIIERLKAQSALHHPANIIEVTGAVKFPGTYPLPEGKSLNQVIKAAGGLGDDAYLTEAEITRKKKTTESYQVSHASFALNAVLNGEEAMTLQPLDHLVIKKQPDWQQGMTIDLQGEVKFPGTYTFQRGDRLEDVVSRAGGFTRFAYAKGAVFSRVGLKRQEQERLALLNLQLKQEIGGLALRRQSSSATYTTSPTDALAIADELAKTEAVGRLVINLEQAMAGDEAANVMLEKGDKLYVPATNPTIAVMGEVQFASNHTYKPGVTVEDYLLSAGGTKKQADTDRVYIVRADGSVMVPNNSFWFSRKQKPLAPGDTIIVPIDTDYLDGLSTLTSATQVLYQIGVAWSAVKD